ncbi:MaoC family dehydratase N-terminal domain-containing protein, partial [Mycolicibacter hiberniae]|nr:MaoC family dehydratase N-terminal domain-containing protein [Mycolicibacter hiberniae]
MREHAEAVKSEPDHYVVEREKIREHAEAVKSEHPAHHDEAGAAALGYDSLVAPPT